MGVLMFLTVENIVLFVKGSQRLVVDVIYHLSNEKLLLTWQIISTPSFLPISIAILFKQEKVRYA